jgi:uncharacterized DUF497 family protein
MEACMGDFSGRDKLGMRVFDTVEESMRYYGFEDTRKGLGGYAGDLESGDVSCPGELRGDAVSQNGQCEWSKKKAFINEYKHGVSFEVASWLYSENPPPGYRILYDDPADNGEGLESLWGIDIRDTVVARLGGIGCFLVKVDREHVHSGRIRLISVRKVSEKAVVEAIKKHETNSSVSVLARVVVGTLGKKYITSSESPVLEEMNRRVLAYENVRYLARLM